jgi:hypothetical protein
MKTRLDEDDLDMFGGDDSLKILDLKKTGIRIVKNKNQEPRKDFSLSIIPFHLKK